MKGRKEGMRQGKKGRKKEGRKEGRKEKEKRKKGGWKGRGRRNRERDKLSRNTKGLFSEGMKVFFQVCYPGNLPRYFPCTFLP